MDYSNQLEMIEKGKLNGSNSLYIGTPSNQLQSIGFSEKPFAMNQGDYRKSRRASAKNKNYSSHAVPYDFFENMPQYLADAPLFIDNGIKVTAVTSYEMLDTKGNDSYVIAGVWKDQTMESDTVNQVKSVYPLDDFIHQITEAAEVGKLVCINKNKAEQMLATIGIQPAEVSRILNLSKDILPQNSEKSSGNVDYSLSEDIDNVEKILYDKNNSLSIVNRAKTYNNSSLKWVYDSEIFSVEESKLFHEKISEINQGSEAFSKNSADEYMIPIENKIIFTDGNYDSPYVREIVEVLTDNQTDFDDIRECIYSVEKGESEKQDAARYVQNTFGKGCIVSYKSGNNGVYGWEDGKRKGKSRSSVIRNHLNKQLRRRNDSKSKKTQINEIAPINEASSKDGVFFDGEKTRVTNQGESKIAYDCGINKNRG